MTRQAYILPNHNLTVFWTPKAACTTIVHKICLEILKVNRDELVNETGGMRGWLIGNGYWYEGNQAAKITIERNYTSIALIREPYDRLVSSFTNKFIKNASGPITSFQELEIFAQEFYCEIKGHKLNESKFPYTGLTFREFATAVTTKIESRRGKEPNLDSHWNTQIPFSFIDNDFNYNHIYNLESSSAFFSKLSELVNQPLTNEKLNATKYSEPTNELLVDVRSIDIAKENNIAKPQFQDSELRDCIFKAFDVDITYLNKVSYNNNI